jgi:type II restriction/modification system DNA methylase subunit YeeA
MDAYLSKKKWFPYNKGGEYRKWFGNNEYLVNYEHKGQTICDYIDNTPGAKVGSNGRVINREHYFKPSITWSFVSSSYFGVRYSPEGFVFDVGGSSVFPDLTEMYWLTGFLCSKMTTIFLRIMNPTLNFQVGNVAALPIINISTKEIAESIIKKIISISKSDWDNYETSWDFSNSPILNLNCRQKLLSSNYSNLRAHWKSVVLDMLGMEEENNRVFIEAYSLQNELTPDVPIKEITLTCNPHYRYGGDKTDEELEAKLLADTMKEFISYAVGCMFGRYSLDKPGLILANQSDTFEDYRKLIPNSSFPVDEDNVIPILDGDWFTDDISERFNEFLRITFGKVHYEENLKFIVGAIGKTVRDYFLNDF